MLCPIESSQQSSEAVSIILPILQMRKVRRREVKDLGQVVKVGFKLSESGSRVLYCKEATLGSTHLAPKQTLLIDSGTLPLQA